MSLLGEKDQALKTSEILKNKLTSSPRERPNLRTRARSNIDFALRRAVKSNPLCTGLGLGVAEVYQFVFC